MEKKGWEAVAFFKIYNLIMAVFLGALFCLFAWIAFRPSVRRDELVFWLGILTFLLFLILYLLWTARLMHRFSRQAIGHMRILSGIELLLSLSAVLFLVWRGLEGAPIPPIFAGVMAVVQLIYFTWPPVRKLFQEP